MRLVIVAVGQKMPAWAQTAVDDYAKRFGADVSLEIKTVKTEGRHGQSVDATMNAERKRLQGVLDALRSPRVVVLDERGAALTTAGLAEKITHWQSLSVADVALIIGGPDGLSTDFKAAAHERIQLSHLTLPHALARVLLVEALYRAVSLNSGHPYHRE
jgi:23S rRNA (pseudouridine1915-N3)-methyltransferase